MERLKGIPASPGLAIGPVYVLRHDEHIVERRSVADPEAELLRLDAALDQAQSEIEAIRARTAEKVGESEAQVFDAHLLMLQDPSLVDAARDLVQSERIGAEWAFHSAAEEAATVLAGLDDPYLRERAADVRDVAGRVVRILMGRSAASLSDLAQPSVVVAHDLTPSETAQLDRNMILGFATEIGGPTSHSAIMSRTLGIPAVVGLGAVMDRIADSEQVVLDGAEGSLIIRPEADAIRAAEQKAETLKARRAQLQQVAALPFVTADGRAFEVAANIGKPSEAAESLPWGAQGVGLFRTEFLYMDRGTLPTEEEQYQAYKAALEHMGPERGVIIRTLDIGGDKQLEALPLPVEANPFLGLRAIRLCFDRKDLFRTQLRALLRASVHGRLRIMYPMIQSLQELQTANAMLAEARAELERADVAVGTPKIGIMIEIPAAAVIADLLAPHVDFFSIGTNDLIQYTLAVDRMNERVSHLYQPYHPAVLRLIRQVCKAAHDAGKWAGMCGEMAGDPVAAPVLLGLGLEEWSMSAPSIPAVKEVLRATHTSDAQALVAELIGLDDPVAIRAKAEAFYRERVGAQ